MIGMNRKKFTNLNFEDFKKMSRDKNLSIYEKIGFPDSYRKDKFAYSRSNLNN